MIAGAFGFKGYEMPDWHLFLKTLDKKPKMNINLTRFIFEQALNSGNDRQLIYFSCLASKGTQQIVTQLIKDRNNWLSIEIILNSFSDSSIMKAEQLKLHKSVGFLASIIEQQNKSQFICKLNEIGSKIEELSLASLASPKKKAILTDIAKILLIDDFAGAFADAFSPRKASDELVRLLIRNFDRYLDAEKPLVDFIKSY